MKKNIIIILIIVIIALGGILAIKFIQKNKDTEVSNEKIENNMVKLTESIESNNMISNEENNNNTKLSNEEIEDGMAELKHSLENKKDKIVLIVNGEEISEREIAYIDFQLNNKYVTKGEISKDAIAETIEQYVILQDARKNNMTLTNDRNRQIEERTKKNLKEGTEETNQFLEAFNMQYDDFIEFYIDRTKKSEIILQWKTHIIDEINNGKIKIDDKNFNSKYSEYKSSTDVSKRYKLLTELKEIYIQFLKNKARVENIR